MTIPLVFKSLKKKLSNPLTEIESIHTANTINQGLEIYSLLKPDILLLDIDLGNDTIFSLLEVIAPSESEIIFISSHKDFGVEAVYHNIAAYILKPIKIVDLKKGVFMQKRAPKKVKTAKKSSKL